MATSATAATTVNENAAAEPTRRDFLYLGTGIAGAVGVAFTVWPFISSMGPDAETVAAGAPVELDLAPIAEGQIVKLFWRGKLIFVRHLTEKEMADARQTDVRSLPDPQPFDARAYKARNIIERTIGRLKDWRRIHTRYDKLAANFASAVAIAGDPLDSYQSAARRCRPSTMPGSQRRSSASRNSRNKA